MDEKNEPGAPLVLAELKNSDGFREFLVQQITKYSGDKDAARLEFVEDPKTFTANAENNNERLYIWIQNGLFAASPKLEQTPESADCDRRRWPEQFHDHSVPRSHQSGL
jgi:hypothetical protein